MHTLAIYVGRKWPDEAVAVPRSKGLAIAYRERPERSAPVVATLHLPAGAPLCPGGDPGVIYRNLAPEVWMFIADVTFDLLPLEIRNGDTFVDSDHPRAYPRPKGSSLDVVDYEGEGNYVARVDGQFYHFLEPSMVLAGHAVAEWTVRSKRRSEVWFEVSAPGTERQRWVLNDAKTVTIDTHG